MERRKPTHTSERYLFRDSTLSHHRKEKGGISLVVRWLRVGLPMQGPWMGSIPRQGARAPHAVGQLSLCAAATEKPGTAAKDSACLGEAPTCCS